MRITIRNLQKRILINPKRIRKIVLKVISKEKTISEKRRVFTSEASSLKSPQGQINICFVNAREIKRLNRDYSDNDSSTDVLAFDLSNKTSLYLPKETKKNKILCDIFVSTDAAVSNSRIFKTTPLYESHLYVIHGLLHILGYDDRTAQDRAVMRKKEKEYIEGID